MTIRLQCPHCGKKIKAPESHAGKRALCPRCREEIFVPGPTPSDDQALPGNGASAQGGGGHGGADDGGLLPQHLAHEEEDLIDMTAMVDIVFFLLIFFMVTSMHANQASISVPPPDIEKKDKEGGQGKKQDDETTTVRIEADGTVLVDDEEAPSRQDLIAKLRDSGDTHMVVRAHAEATHGRVVMVLDAGTDAGVDDVRLITEDDSGS